MSCFTYEGIEAIKGALRAGKNLEHLNIRLVNFFHGICSQIGLALSSETFPIKINLIAPPLYVMTTSTPERQDGLQV